MAELPRPWIRAVSETWSALSWGADQAVRRGWLKPVRLPARVVSVGNIQAGGAGKTPLVAWLAREAASRGLKACILCRGYGGRWESSGGVILPGGELPPTAECGDEAALLHELAPAAVLGIGADRVGQFERVRAHGGVPDLVILDDGFQHWKIHKDLEIVALTSAGPGEVPFRDWPGALRRADMLVWTKGDREPAARLVGKPWARCRYRLPEPQGAERQAPLWLVTGVADGESVARLAREQGYRIDRHLRFADHARYSAPEARRLDDSAAEAGARLAMTGKDWVKWRELGVARVPLRLEPELEWMEGRDQWNRLLWGG